MVRRAPRDEDEDADPTLIAYQAQRRILQLKRERDERIQAVVAESDAQLEDLKARIASHLQELHSEKTRRQAEQIAQAISLVERRRDIEQRMGDAVGRAHALMRELGDLMAVAYEGRLADARAARGQGK